MQTAPLTVDAPALKGFSLRLGSKRCLDRSPASIDDKSDLEVRF